MYNTTIAISAHFNFIVMELVFNGFSIVAMVVATGAALVLIGHRWPKYYILINITVPPGTCDSAAALFSAI